MDVDKTIDLQELIKNEKREYYRKWREKNKDKVRQHNQNYWKRKAQERIKANVEVEQNG